MSSLIISFPSPSQHVESSARETIPVMVLCTGGIVEGARCRRLVTRSGSDSRFAVGTLRSSSLLRLAVDGALRTVTQKKKLDKHHITYAIGDTAVRLDIAFNHYVPITHIHIANILQGRS